MPLILAIEPDRQQAAQLGSIARGRIGAELVLADSAERALRELGDRIPDLILTPQLLSPRDDAAISNRLREFGAAATYVQTLTIPTLATHQPGAPSRAGGLLSKLRRQKAAPADAPNGCAPDVFADQIAVYLERALEARQAQGATEPPARIEPAVVAVTNVAPAIVPERVVPAPEPVNEPTSEARPASPLWSSVLESTSSIFRSKATTQDTGGRQAEPVVERPVAATPYIEVAPEPVILPEPEASSGVLESVDSIFRKVEATRDMPPEVLVTPEPVVAHEPPIHVAAAAPVEEVAPEADLTSLVEAIVEPVREIVPEPERVPEAVVAPAPVAVPEPVVVPEVVERPRPSKPAKPAVKKKKARQATPRNDWNFFDPEETRFAALLARLDEITRHDAAQQSSRPQA